jgi:hypothetical protein
VAGIAANVEMITPHHLWMRFLNAKLPEPANQTNHCFYFSQEFRAMHPIVKFVRTRHIEGSRHQLGDKPDDKPLAELEGLYLVQEEKLDGANSGFSFDPAGQIYLQSRGHYLTGGGRERHFSLFKTWGSVHSQRFFEALSDRFIVYGEWLYAKHTTYYNALPAYFMEFDVWDREREVFLSTDARRTLLKGLPIVPVPVLAQGTYKRGDSIAAQVQPTLYREGDWKADLMEDADTTGSRPDMVLAQSDLSDLSEGLCIKVEKGDLTVDRFKYVRGDFLQTIQSSDSHWHDRPIIPNRLAAGIDIFAPQTGVPGAYDDPDFY